MTDAVTAIGGSNTEAERGEAEENRLPKIEKGVRELPGLVRLFQAQLWLTIIGGGLGAAWAFFMLLTYELWRYGPPWPPLFALCLLLGCFILALRAERAIAEYIRYYNEERLNSAIGYITPADKLAGREKLIFAERDRKLEEARKRRAQARQSAA